MDSAQEWGTAWASLSGSDWEWTVCCAVLRGCLELLPPCVPPHSLGHHLSAFIFSEQWTFLSPCFPVDQRCLVAWPDLLTHLPNACYHWFILSGISGASKSQAPHWTCVRIYSHYCNEILHVGWLINNRNLFLMALSVKIQNLVCEEGLLSDLQKSDLIVSSYNSGAATVWGIFVFTIFPLH